MNKKKQKDFPSSSNPPSTHGKRSFRQWLIEPAESITENSERRQASLVSALLLVMTVTMISGVIYMGFFSSNPTVGIVLAGADLAMGTAYILSRTRHNRSAALLSLIILAVIPILNISLGTDHTSEGLLILLIWNILTILLSSAIATIRVTVGFAIINITTLLLLSLLIPDITIANMMLPLIFNVIVSVTILVLTWHRNLIEKDHMLALFQANQQLQTELTERRRAEEQLAYTALHDPLTDLPNRALFMDRLRHAMEHARRHKNFSYAVFFIDLDRFKVVNDSLGHNIGDSLLVECANRLTECVREEDTVARLGGDEFVVLLEEVEGSTDYLSVAKRILNRLASPADLEKHRVIFSASMGVVLSDAQYKQAEDIVRDADIAMYYAKKHGRCRYEIFEPAMRDQAMTQLEMESDLRKAVENQEFIVHYQPILDMKTRRITGFEALVRWQHPTKGLFPPADFISTAEENGLIVPIGYWVLNEACRQIHDWQTQFPADPPLTMNVNLSTRQCAESDLIEKIVEILQKNELDPSSLKLELTESLIMEDSKPIAVMLSKLRELGIQVHIDDFGTGYSSLGYLNDLPIDTLKIDRTFISRLGANGSGTEIVQMILALAHSLGMKVVAEGVETDDQFSRLMAMDCEYMQGFLFAEPVDSQKASALLENSPFNQNS